MLVYRGRLFEQEIIPRRISTKMFDYVQRRSRTCGFEFNLSRSWILEKINSGHCEITGIKFDLSKSGSKKIQNDFSPSIDRIDSLKGYTKDNCQMVIWLYNRIKSNKTDDEILFIAKAIVARNAILCTPVAGNGVAEPGNNQ